MPAKSPQSGESSSGRPAAAEGNNAGDLTGRVSDSRPIATPAQGSRLATAISSGDEGHASTRRGASPAPLFIATPISTSASAVPTTLTTLPTSPRPLPVASPLSPSWRQQSKQPYERPGSAASRTSRVRSPSPLSISDLVREPFSAYSRAYAIPHHPSISSLRQAQGAFSARSERRSEQGTRAGPTHGEDSFERQRHQAQSATGRRPTTVAELTEFGGLEYQEGFVIGQDQSDLEYGTMPLGIWDTKDGKAPGTVSVMSSEEGKGAATAMQGSMSPENTLNPKLKYDRSGSRPILLVPQPSDDPNDPLNWPRWKRDVIIVVLSMMSVIASTLSPLLAANTWSLTVDFMFEYTFTDMALLTGYHLLAVGLSGFLFVATARVWGKRHLYLLGCLLIIASSAWGGATGLNYKSLLGARIVQGIGLAPFEALVNASVADLFFVHERGSRMALSNMALFGGAFFTPIIVGKITSTLGWQWTFYFVAIFSGVMFPFIFFLVPETTYSRPEGAIAEVDSLGNPLVPELDGDSSRRRASGLEAVSPTAGSFSGPMAGTGNDPVQNRAANEKESTGSSAEEARNGSSGPPRYQQVPYWKTLLPFNGRHSEENVIKLVLRPLPLFLQPAVLWACLIQGTLIGWTVLMGVVLATVFLPLGFTEKQTGYLYTGPFIGAFVGFILCGILADWSAKALIRANKGVYEPEFRLPLVILQLAFGCSGLYGFGWTSEYVRYGGANSWFWPDFCFALEVAGMIVGAVVSALYIVDAHRDVQVEAFTCLLIFKNVFSFALTYQAFNWLKLGYWHCFKAIGSVQVGICALTIPMCKYQRISGVQRCSTKRSS